MRLSDGVTLRLLEAGPTAGPPVLLLHGWAISAYLWRQTIPALAAAGFRVYAVDLPGHGLSDSPNTRGSYTLDAMTTRIALLLDELRITRVAVVAQSMGGRIAVELARRVPGLVSRLVLFGPVGFGDISPAQAYVPLVPPLPGALLANLISRELVDIIQRRVYGKLGWFTERDIDEYWAPTQFADVVAAQLQMLREFDWAPHDEQLLAGIAVPTLVVFGTRDRTVRPVHAVRLIAAMPHARLHWIEDGGHTVMEEVAGDVNALLITDLGELSTAT